MITLRPSRLQWWWMAIALGVLAVVAGVAISFGAVSLDFSAIVRSILDRLPFVEVDSGLDERQEAILWAIRLPRVVLGGLVGATLALAGGAYQGSFRNPLADPYLLGVAAGAGLGATIAIAYLSASTLPISPLLLLAFAGGIGGVALTYLVGFSVRAGRTSVTLILAGVAVAAFLTAVQTYLLQREVATLRQVYGWILGRLTTVGWDEVLLILPWAIPNYITALIWQGMFHSQFGVINQVIQMFGGEGLSWFDSPFTAFITVLSTNGWLSFPFMMVISLGALQSIPNDLYEAARVDGATRWQQFKTITLPSLKPALVPAVIISVIWTFNQFNVIYLVSGGEPGGSTEILITEAYKIAFEQYRYGYAAAYSVVIFIILLTYGIWQNRVTGASEGV